MQQVPVELGINDLRSELARQSARQAELLAKISELEEQAANRAEREDPGESARNEIMRELTNAGAGKPGPLTVAQLMDQCNATKSKIHTHVNELEKKGKVWVRKSHDPVNGRPCTIVYPASMFQAIDGRRTQG